MTDEMMRRLHVAEPDCWYVVKTNPKAEDKVVSGLAEKGITAYVPKLRVWRPVKRPKPGKPRKRAVESPLFVGYALCGFAATAGRDFGLVRGVDGVHSFIAVQGAPLALPASEVEKIRAEENAGLYDETRHRPPKFMRGQAVRVSHGPFAGFDGHVAQMKPGDRVKVLFSILGSVSAVTLGQEQVEAVGSGSV